MKYPTLYVHPEHGLLSGPLDKAEKYHHDSILADKDRLIASLTGQLGIARSALERMQPAALKWEALISSRMYCMGWAGFNSDEEDGYRHITINLWTYGPTPDKTPHDLGYGWEQDTHGLFMLNQFIDQAVLNPTDRRK